MQDFETGPSEKSSSLACILVERVDFIIIYITLTFVYCLLFTVYIVCCCEDIFVRDNVFIMFARFKMKKLLHMKLPTKFNFLM